MEGKTSNALISIKAVVSKYTSILVQKKGASLKNVLNAALKLILLNLDH